MSAIVLPARGNDRANVGNKRGRGRAHCSMPDCERVVKGRGLCEKHYMRAYRHGDPTAGEGRYGNGYVMPSGYVLLCIPGHPLARAKGHVLAHRAVLYDAIGPGPHTCHWCTALVDWRYGVVEGALVVDHVDGVRTHNDLSNLVPSCNACNVGRAT